MKIRNIVAYLREKNKLSLRNVRTGRESWHVFVSRLNLGLASLAFLLLVFLGVVMLVAYTPVLDLVPGYKGARSRDALVRNVMLLDSLSAEMEKWEAYQETFARILDGQLPLPSADTLLRQGLRGSVVPPSEMDSVLRMQMTGDGSPYRLNEAEENRRRAETSFEMLPPVQGILVQHFAPESGIYGVEISPAPNQTVLSVLDGTVILSAWNPQSGNLVMIQHGGNMVSVYKQLSDVIRSEGEHVRAGEALGMTGTLTENRVPNIVFELWYNGSAVDPENYITF